MTASSGWRFGMPWTDEMKAKARETRAGNKGAKPKHRRPPPPRPETAPRRTGSPVAEKTRGKIVALVARLLGFGEAGVAWTAKQITKPVHRVDPATGEVMLDNEGRPIIEHRVRSFSDESIAEDKLEEWEQRWLADELTDELIRYPKIRAWLLKMVEFEERSSLPMCVTILALPRLANHGIIPPDFRKMVDEMHEAARKAHRGAKRAEPEALTATPPIEEPEATATAAD